MKPRKKAFIRKRNKYKLEKKMEPFPFERFKFRRLVPITVKNLSSQRVTPLGNQTPER